jgi:hypothetical protein
MDVNQIQNKLPVQTVEEDFLLPQYVYRITRNLTSRKENIQSDHKHTP